MDRMEKTCANCVNSDLVGEHYTCKLAVHSISGKPVTAAAVRISLINGISILYHSKVTEPCGAEGLYWEDRRAPIRIEKEPKEYTPRKGEKCKVIFEEAAAEMLNDGLLPADDNLANALTRMSEGDVWSKPFKAE